MKWFIVITLILVLAAAPAAYAAGLIGHRGHSHASSRDRVRSELVLDIARRGSGAVAIMRSGHGDPRSVGIPRSSHITARDGRPLVPADILSGDTLAVHSDGSIVDTSQVQVRLDGVVAHSPDSNNGPITVLVNSSQWILVDIEPSTHIAGTTLTSPPLSGIQEADLVRINGLLDQNMGEMIQTDSITRLGP